MGNRILKFGLPVVFLGFAGLVACRVLFLKTIYVPNGAMANTIIPGDYLTVRRALGELRRGDIIVFKYPKDSSVQYVSRVIGLPRESIQIRKHQVYVNGGELSERRVIVKPDYDLLSGSLEELSAEGQGSYSTFYFNQDETNQGVMPSDSGAAIFGTAQPFQIPDAQYFVMGDNRDSALDSRFWGTVPRELIWGKVGVIYFSVDPTHSEGATIIRWNRIFTSVK
jgi:signal peptidase I